MKDYILKRFNPYLKSKLEFSNLESLDNDKNIFSLISISKYQSQ